MKRRRFWVVSVAALATVLVTASLGRWQLDRAAQKTALQAAITARASLPPWSAADLLSAADAPGAVHRPVRLVGRWVPDHTVFLDNRQMAGRVGFFVVTPLRLSDSGRAVLVQRGWVPRDFQDRARVPVVPTPSQEVVVEGRLAAPPGQLYELGEGATGAIRQNIDLAAFGRETGLNLLPVSVLQTGDTGEALARQWPQPAVDVAKHHGYAFQWFALCALVAGLYLWFQIIQPRRVRAQAHGPDA